MIEIEFKVSSVAGARTARAILDTYIGEAELPGKAVRARLLQPATNGTTPHTERKRPGWTAERRAKVKAAWARRRKAKARAAA